MKRIVTIALVALALNQARSQNYEKRPWMALENRLGLAVGIGSVTYLDKNSSPLVYQSKPKNVRLFYNLETNHFLFSVDLDMRVGGNNPKHVSNRNLLFLEEDYKGNKEEKRFPAGGSWMAGRVSLGAFYKIASTQESTFKVAVGGRVCNDLFYPQGWTSGGLMNALSFSPEAWTQHWIDRHHSFTASARLPLITRLTRLPYANTVSAPDKSTVQGFFRHSAWQGPAKFLAPTVTLGYHYQFNSHWGAGLQYEWGWYNVAVPQTMRAVNQAFLANFFHQL